MSFVERGEVRGGTIVFARPLELPEGAEVVVRIESVNEGKADAALSEDVPFEELPFFGMWADREDLEDGAAWVRKERG